MISLAVKYRPKPFEDFVTENGASGFISDDGMEFVVPDGDENVPDEL